MRFTLKASLLAVVMTVIGTTQSQAAFVFVGSRATLAGTDNLDWGTKGAEFTVVSNPFNITSTGGTVATVSQAVAASSWSKTKTRSAWSRPAR